MPKSVFYSFHFDADAWRAAQVRKIGTIEGNEPVRDNDWETVKRGGDAAIERWIKNQMDGRRCLVVLAGSGTANRKWINYEISEAWNRGMGVFGIRIHRLLDRNAMPSSPGANPFDYVHFTHSRSPLSTRVVLHDPGGAQSTDVYRTIASNIESWIDGAIRSRG
jgi:hypothetical protein